MFWPHCKRHQKNGLAAESVDQIGPETLMVILPIIV
jgi:hypothetical protein